jgi:hypothetical protein
MGTTQTTATARNQEGAIMKTTTIITIESNEAGFALQERFIPTYAKGEMLTDDNGNTLTFRTHRLALNHIIANDLNPRCAAAE